VYRRRPPCPCPRRKGKLVIRLWNRVGIFRALSVFVLVVGIVGAVFVADRQSQQRSTAATPAAAEGTTTPPGVAQSPTVEQSEAQRKADEAATAAAAQAQAAEADTRKSQPASRGESRSASPSPSGKTGAPAGPAPASCQQYTGHRQTGCTIMVNEWKFPLDQMPCLEKLWTKESGWNPLARNKSSGAGGIPQALPMSKMSSYGSDYATNATVQIRWGLSYIKGKYKTPCGAWSYFQSKGYY
jgi:hypothetical protein